MNFFTKKLSTSFEAAKQNIQNKFDSERIQMVEISKLKFDKDFKELFSQEPEVGQSGLDFICKNP